MAKIDSCPFEITPMSKTNYHPIRGLPGKTEAKKSASMFMGKYAHSAENQQKLLVQP